MKAQAQERIHSLEIPVRGMALLVPSASVAEVVTAGRLAPVPGSPAWQVGVLGWRLQAVPVISFEAVTGGTPIAAGEAAKIVVFYPLPGRRPFEFFGVLTESEPRPRSIDAATAIAADPTELLDTPYVAAGLKSDGALLAIPNFGALKTLFYG